MRSIAGENDTDVVPRKRNVIFGVRGICIKRIKSRFVEIKRLKCKKAGLKNYQQEKQSKIVGIC